LSDFFSLELYQITLKKSASNNKEKYVTNVHAK